MHAVNARHIKTHQFSRENWNYKISSLDHDKVLSYESNHQHIITFYRCCIFFVFIISSVFLTSYNSMMTVTLWIIPKCIFIALSMCMANSLRVTNIIFSKLVSLKIRRHCTIIQAGSRAVYSVLTQKCLYRSTARHRHFLVYTLKTVGYCLYLSFITSILHFEKRTSTK